MTMMIALLLLAAAQDTVRFKDRARNPDLEGDVVSMTLKSVDVEILLDGVRVKRTVDARDVAEIVPKRTIDFIKAEEAIANGDFGAAVQRYERVAADPRAGELLRQTASIEIVRTHLQAENRAAVVLSARALRARKPDGFYVAESYHHEAKTHLAARDAKKADETIKEFLALGQAQVIVEWIRSAELLSAGVSELKGDWRVALQAYRKHAKDPEVADETSLGEMRCLTAIGDWPALRRRADAVIAAKNAESRPLIAAYTGKGDLEMNDGKPKEALLNYLQGALVLNRGGKSPEHEVALARSSITLAKMAASEKDRLGKATLRDRAQELSRELASIYPRSALRGEVDRAIQESR
jgi:hypothetical protein